MAGRLRTVGIVTNTDGAYTTSLGIVLETNGTTALLDDASFSGSSAVGIVLPGGLAPIGAPAHGAAAPALVGNGATGPDRSDIRYTGTYTNGIVLSDPATQNPVTVAATGYVTNLTGGIIHNGDAVYGAPGVSWTLTNLGKITSETYGSDGVHLTTGGVLTNGQEGSSTGLIAGYLTGVDIAGANGTVLNFGTIFAEGGIYSPFHHDYGIGVHLGAGGSVTNGQSGSLEGSITGTAYGVDIGGGSGTVTNFGTIDGKYGAVRFGGGDDLLVAEPGAVFIGKVDGGGGNNTLELAPGAGPGLLSGLGTNFVNFGSVVFDANAAWTVTLDDPAAFTGTFYGFASGDFLDLTSRIATDVSYSGGVLSVLNGPDVVATVNLTGSLTSADFTLTSDGLGGTDIGIATSAAPVTVSPLPNIAGASVGGAAASNTTASDPIYSGTYVNGIVLSNPATQNPTIVAATGYITNRTGDHNGDAIYGAPVYPWTVANLGTVYGPGYAAGVHLTAGGVLTNGQSGSTAALIEGNYGVRIDGGVGTVSNFGTIFGGEGYFLGAGVELVGGGSVTNGQSGSTAGLIAGGGSNQYAGVAIFGGLGSVTNFGTIRGRTSALILGAGGSVANFGTIDGPFSGSGIMLGALASTVTNAGAIIGSSGTAVQFGGGDDLLVADPGAVFMGKVDGGGGNNTLELAAGAGPGLLSGLGTNFVNFGSVVFDPGAPWTVTLDNPAAFTGTISGFAKGDFIDLTGTAATGVSYSGGVLTVLNGSSVVVTLNLAGPYTSADFTLSPDGHGGTDIGTQISVPTADMILRQGSTGEFEIYNLGNNVVLGASALGQVGTEWVFMGLGDFNGTDSTDMILRDSNTGVFEVYDISSDTITAATSMGQVGLEWQLAGFGNFNGPSGGTDMMLRNVYTGVFELYDITNNTVTSANPFGQVGLEWQVAGFGDFNGDGTTDMMLRNTQTGFFEVYDINNSKLTSWNSLGQVGLEWQIAGFGAFDGDGTTGMMLRDVNTEVFELYDIQNNQVISASSIGQVGLEWQVAGFGPIAGPNTSDMVLRNTQTGAFEIYDFANNQLTGAASLGQVGLEWQVGGIAPDPLIHSPSILG
jgi:hypothetical protein